MTRVLIVGGTGAFGARIAERLASTTQFDIIIASRDVTRAQGNAQKLSAATERNIQAVAIDSRTVTPNQLAQIAPDITLNASGPFQDETYTLAETAIAVGSHYIDLADARHFVLGISRLDDAAKQAGVCVISGASSVPGLSSVVLAKLMHGLERVDHVEIGISPGNHFTPGPATTRSVLKGLGRPIPVRRNGGESTVYGWQNLRRATFGGLGKRWLSNVDVPDLALIPQHVPSAATVEFQAGTELSIQHLGLWAVSWLARAGVLKHPDRLTKTLLTLKRLTHRFGSESGGMRVVVTGQDRYGRQIKKLWTLVGHDGHGPFVPTIASTALTKLLVSRKMTATGAMACFDLFPYAAIAEETAGLSITCTIERAVR